jgi:hypothetical protein
MENIKMFLQNVMLYYFDYIFIYICMCVCHIEYEPGNLKSRSTYHTIEA